MPASHTDQGQCVNAWVGSGACGTIPHLKAALAKHSELTHPPIFGKQSWAGCLPFAHPALWITSPPPGCPRGKSTDKITFIPGTFYRDRPMDETPQVGQKRAQAKITQTFQAAKDKSPDLSHPVPATPSLVHFPWRMEVRQQESWPKVTSRKPLNKAKCTQKQHPALPSQSG